MIYHLISSSVYQTFMLMMGLCTHMIKTLKTLKSSYKENLIMQTIGAKKTNFHHKTACLTIGTKKNINESR